ncbi:hypothetical protein [Microvirga soli]|uniref:hypothetical protein n=1 Tax=Microvirga soli TaxID=1854496 RepID=UPI00191F3916|nr:hypothetical protein [Microvirga soli]
MAQSNAERQRNHKERLKQKAAEGVALAELMLENQRASEELMNRFERAVLQIERNATEHTRPAGMRSLSPEEAERLVRIKQIRCFREDGHIEPESQTYRFLGMSAQRWLDMPDELLSVFGMVEVVTEWHRQVNASMAIDRARQPEDRDIERFLAREANGHGEIDNGQSQAQEELSMPATSVGVTEKPTVNWFTLDRVHRDWCLGQYPNAPLSSAERYKPDGVDSFEYDGAFWVKKVSTRTLADGSSIIQARFVADDGRKVFEP